MLPFGECLDGDSTETVQAASAVPAVAVIPFAFGGPSL